MKKLTIVALHLGYGGIEKAISSLANMLCDKYDIEIISTYKLFDKPAFNIDERVKIRYLMNKKPNREEFKKAIKRFRFFSILKETFKALKILYLKKSLMIKAIKELDSDIIISTRAFHNELVGKYANKKSLKIAWEHSHHNNNKKYINSLVKSCNNVDYLVTVSNDLKNFYEKFLGSKCIHIKLSLDKIPEITSSLDNKEIISVGRLSPEKGFLDLIDVFKLVNEKYPDWHLNIVGDGIEKEKIEEKIKIYNLDKSITMHGYKNKDEVNEILNKSSIYVMTSLSESFGLVLIEAMSFGIPCIAFDSAQGALEIIDENTGFIIKDRNINEMSNKIIYLIENEKERKKLGKSARDKSLLFEQKNIKNNWLELLEKN